MGASISPSNGFAVSAKTNIKGSTYATYDTVLVGRTTYEEMAAYWPSALRDGEGTETNRRMASRMNDYKKLVFSKSGQHALTEWNNTEQVVARGDGDLRDYLVGLKAQAGGNIHVSGGARFAQSVIGLELVDEYHFFVYPAVSPGLPWFEQWPDSHRLELLATDAYENGVVWLHYAPRDREVSPRPDSFSGMLT